MTSHKKILIDLFIEHHDRFLSIADLSALIPLGVQIDQTTIYRAVQNLEKNGLVESASTDKGHTGYVLRHSDHHHHHLICTGCGQIVSIPCHPDLWQDVANQYNFQETHHKVEIYGLCEACQKIDKHSSP
ncbi:MAG: transcriptional repressor [Eubacteriales bacterium]|nr:transcriptional repressor [Eubacteriales bacterium]